MEFNFNIENLGIKANNGIIIIEGDKKLDYTSKNYQNLNFLLDTIGELSAKVKIYI